MPIDRAGNRHAKPWRLSYYEVLEILQLAAAAHEVVGIDLVEAAPDHDHSGSTAILAAQVLLNFLGFIFHARGAR